MQYHNCIGNSFKCTGPCDNLPLLFNGMITYNTSQGLHNTVATYTCNDGFTLLGSHLRICEEGVWEEASPSCLQDGKVYNTVSMSTSCTTAWCVNTTPRLYNYTECVTVTVLIFLCRLLCD